MKLIIFNILFFITGAIVAQEQIVPLTESSFFDEQDDVTYYYKDVNNDLNKFLGTWTFQDTNSELIVTFYFNEHHDLGGAFYDGLYAKFKYTENGAVIYDTLLDNSIAAEYHIFGGTIFQDTLNKTSLSYYEPTNIPYRGEWSPILYLELLPCNTIGCTPQLKWDLYWAGGEDSDPWPFKIPSNMVLDKQ